MNTQINMNLHFYINPASDCTTPYFGLFYNNWDDYNHKTSFVLYYYDNQSNRTVIGSVKIMHIDTLETINVIDNEFIELHDEYCSLGQDMNYYERLEFEFPDNYKEVLESLNDAAFFNGIKDKFEYTDGFRHSLIRNSEAEKVLYEAKNTIQKIHFEQDFKFSYNCNIENVEGKHKVDFNFGDQDNLPNRIIALIGKNGTGKTQFLAHLALDLSGKSRRKLKQEIFFPKRPLFSKVIAVSYSIFDKFSRPTSDKEFSYKYCGLKDEKGRLLSGPKIVENYKEAVKKINIQRRTNYWYDILKTIIGDELADFFYEEIFENGNYEIVNNNTSRLLSSGQSFLMYVITEVIANIKPNSLILFDEPEMHLHPNAISNLIRMLNNILIKFKSYAVIATHSPIILQEIPSRYITVFDRQGNIPMLYKLGSESFGENIDTLTENIFKTIEIEEHYKVVLKTLSENHSYKKVLSFFENKLSLNAKTFLLNQYQNPEKELNA